MDASRETWDRDLVTRARAGDEAAFEALCARYEARVQARIEKRMDGKLRRKISVADLMQESLAIASVRLDAFEDRGEGAFGAWLGGIADHKLREARRRYETAAKRDVKREVSQGGVPVPGRTEGRDPTASTVLMAGERRHAVVDAMGRLSADHRRVLELLQLGGHSTAQTAALMERSPEAVRKLYARALTRLADLLAEHEGRRTDD